MRWLPAQALLLGLLAAGWAVPLAAAQDTGGTGATGGTTAEGTGAGAGGPGGDPLVLGQWENPLPPPFDGQAGTFLLSVLAWLVVAALVRFVIGPVLKLLARSTKTTLDDKLLDILATPVVVLLFFVGVRASLESVAVPSGVRRLVDVVGGLVVILLFAYVAYRAWNELALVYAHRLAANRHGTLDTRVLPVLEKLGGVLIILFAAMALFQTLGVGLGWLLAGGAFASLVIGLAAQDTLSNFFSGLHLLLDQPFREGDEIMLETGEVCTVRKVGLRSSHLYHVQNHDLIIVPNNLLATNMVTNLMRPDRKQRVWVDVGVGYSADPDQVKRLMTEAAAGHPLVLREPGNEPVVRLLDFGPPAMRYTLIFWVADYTQRNPVASDLRMAILRRFREAGIELPEVALPMVSPESRR